MRAASPEEHHEPARIAIVRLSHLGDVVLALPLFHALRARFPRAEIAWIVQSEFASLLDGLPGLARVVRFERRGGARAWLALRSELTRFAPELCVDAQGNLKSAFITWTSGAGRRVGPARGDWREPLGCRLLTEHAVAVATELTHAQHRTLALCAHFAPDSELRRDPALTPHELARGREYFATNCGSPAVIVHVPAPGDPRSWPAGNIERLARDLTRNGRRVLLLGGPGEEALARELASLFADDPRVRAWIGRSNLREVAAVFAAAAQADARFVGCDSGPMHLAAACGLRVVVLSGPQAHERTGPWPVANTNDSPHSVVRSPEPPACAPCFRRVCDHVQGNVCMSSITPEQVSAALRIPAAR